MNIRTDLAEEFGIQYPIFAFTPSKAVAAAVTRAGGSVAASFLLGDTVTDVKTAKASGVRVALVSFGPEGPGIARLAPDAMLDHFDGLPALARDWLG